MPQKLIPDVRERWHRRLGLVSALFVLLLAGTGLLLNHARDLGLDRLSLQGTLLRERLGGAPAGPAGVVQALPGGELATVAGRLRMGARDIGRCSHLVGVVEKSGQVLAVCSDRLWLLTPEGEVIDQADGVPEGLTAVGQDEGQVLLRRGGEALSVDLGDLSIQPAVPVPGVSGSEPGARASPLSGRDREGLLPDLHGGRLSGRWGVWLVDVVAILMMGLAVAGIVVWRRHRPG